MARETIGEMQCPLCKKDGAEVRKNAKNKLYFYCKCCGMMQPNLSGGQDKILELATIYGASGKPIDEKQVDIEDLPPLKKADEKPPQKSGGFFDF